MSDPEAAGGAASAKPILESLTLKGALAMAIAFVAAKAGVDAADPALRSLAEALVNVMFYGGALAVGVGRARARGPLQ